MTTYLFDVKVLATVQVEANSEGEALRALRIAGDVVDLTLIGRDGRLPLHGQGSIDGEIEFNCEEGDQ